MQKTYWLILVLVSLFSCRDREVLPPNQYVSWFNDKASGLAVEKEVDGYVFRANLITPEAMAIKELHDKIITPGQFQEKLKRFEGNYYVQLRITDKEGKNNALTKELESTEEFYERVAYFNFFSEPDFKLAAGEDTLHCSLLHFENTYGLLPFNDIQMIFPGDKSGLRSGRDFTLIWYDQVLGNGTLKFQFDKEDIQLIPELKLN